MRVCALVVWLSPCGWLGPGPRGESSLVVGSALVCWCLFARVGVARSQPRPRPRRDVVHTLKAAPGLPVLEGACYYLLLSQSCVAQRQSIRLLIGRLLVRIQPQERLPRPIRVGVFVYLPRREPFKWHMRRKGPRNEDGLARLGRSALGSRDAGARNADLIRQLGLAESGRLASFAQAVREVKCRDAERNACGAHIAKFSDGSLNMQ